MDTECKNNWAYHNKLGQENTDGNSLVGCFKRQLWITLPQSSGQPEVFGEPQILECCEHLYYFTLKWSTGAFNHLSNWLLLEKEQR